MVTHSNLEARQVERGDERAQAGGAARVAEVQQPRPAAQHAQQRQPAAREPHLALVPAPRHTTPFTHYNHQYAASQSKPVE